MSTRNVARLAARAHIQVQTAAHPRAVIAVRIITMGSAMSQSFVHRELILPTVNLENTAILADMPTMEVSE
jgi:hypothetical protein